MDDALLAMVPLIVGVGVFAVCLAIFVVRTECQRRDRLSSSRHERLQPLDRSQVRTIYDTAKQE